MLPVWPTSSGVPTHTRTIDPHSEATQLRGDVVLPPGTRAGHAERRVQASERCPPADHGSDVQGFLGACWERGKPLTDALGDRPWHRFGLAAPQRLGTAD
jgi:hypothetical protein